MAKKRILIIDDEQELVKALKVRLTVSNYEVLIAYDGIEGLEKAQKEKPDLILLDINMPRMDGFQTLEKLKSDSQMSSIPVIMLTARSQVDDVSSGAKAGALDYIVKPFETAVLLEKIRKAL